MTGLSSAGTIVSADGDEGKSMAVLREIIFPPAIRAIGFLRSADSVDDSRSVILVDGDREAAP